MTSLLQNVTSDIEPAVLIDLSYLYISSSPAKPLGAISELFESKVVAGAAETHGSS